MNLKIAKNKSVTQEDRNGTLRNEHLFTTLILFAQTCLWRLQPCLNFGLSSLHQLVYNIIVHVLVYSSVKYKRICSSIYGALHVSMVDFASHNKPGSLRFSTRNVSAFPISSSSASSMKPIKNRISNAAALKNIQELNY